MISSRERAQPGVWTYRFLLRTLDFPLLASRASFPRLLMRSAFSFRRDRNTRVAGQFLSKGLCVVLGRGREVLHRCHMFGSRYERWVDEFGSVSYSARYQYRDELVALAKRRRRLRRRDDSADMRRGDREELIRRVACMKTKRDQSAPARSSNIHMPCSPAAVGARKGAVGTLRTGSGLITTQVLDVLVALPHPGVPVRCGPTCICEHDIQNRLVPGGGRYAEMRAMLQ